MADKKWSEFDLLKSIKGKNIELLTVIEDNTSMTGYDNKRIKLSDILDPINLDITNIKQQIQNIQTEGLDLTTIGIDPPYWYANEDDPENKQLVELSIAKDLKERLDETNSKVQKNIEDIADINEEILDLDYGINKNKIDIDSLQFDVTKIENNYFNKNNIIQTVEDEETGKVPSSNAVFDFVKNAKTEANNYTNTQINEILKKITNLDFSGFYFNDTIKNGDYASGREPDDVVINRLSQKIFVVDDNYLYKELSLNKIEVLEIANKVVDWHNSNMKESYEDSIYTISQKEAHPDFQGKYVGKTNQKQFNLINPMECELGVIPNDDCYLFAERGDIPETDCYIVINDNTQCKKINSSEYVNFIDFIKPEYKNLFYSSIVIKVFWDEYNNWWRIDFHYNSYSSGNINFKNINIQDLFTNSDRFYIYPKYFYDFYQTNSSEVFNDYKQHVPSKIDYFHSINNKGNRFITKTELHDLTFVRPYNVDDDEDDCYCVVIKSSEINLLDYVGYCLEIPLNIKAEGSSETLKEWLKDDNGVLSGKDTITVMINVIYENETYYPVIGFGDYNIDGIYKSDAVNYTKGVFNSRDSNSNSITIPEFSEKLTFKSNFELGTYYQDGGDNYFTDKPSFITGLNNLCSSGGQFIFGENNIPTDSVFIVGAGNFSGEIEYRHTRGNLFEINQNGLIFIKSPESLKNWYKNDNGVLVDNNPGDYSETLNLEYKCLQKILIDLNTKIVELENRVKELENP